jgi:hypothetical protein
MQRTAHSSYHRQALAGSQLVGLHKLPGAVGPCAAAAARGVGGAATLVPPQQPLTSSHPDAIRRRLAQEEL